MIKLTTHIKNPPKEVEEWLDATGKYMTDNFDKIMGETPMVCEVTSPVEETIEGSASEVMSRLFILFAVYGDVSYQLKGVK